MIQTADVLLCRVADTQSQSFEEHKNVLREKYSQAKGLGESVNAARTNINTLKAQLDRARMARGMQSLVPGNEQALLEGMN